MRPLRIIVLEDDQWDFDLTQIELTNNLPEFSCQVEWVSTKEQFLTALHSVQFDVILSDYNLPGYNGLEALQEAKRLSPFTPFIFVTGELQEEKAAETIRHGAWEYVVKDRLFRLPIAIRNALKLKEERLERRQVEEENYRLSLVANSTTNLVKLFDSVGDIAWVNNAFTKLTGYGLEEIKGLSFLDVLDKLGMQDDMKQFVAESFAKGKSFKDIELSVHDKSGQLYWVSAEFQPVRNGKGEIIQYVLLENDITERREAQENLRNKNEELTKINAELDRFVYSASHDLRAPVTSMLGLIEVAKLEKDPQDVFEYLEKQKRALKKMDEFIHEIVNYSRNGRMSIKPEPLDLQKMVQEIFEQYSYLENAKKIAAEVVVVGESTFCSDKQRIGMILSNLISNSLKYADFQKEQPMVKVKISIEPRQGVLEIVDNGEGIREDFISKVFDMFFRATKASTGSGIGLYIVKEVVGKLEGTIEVKSEFGKGTQFKVTLPNLKA